MTGLTIFLGPRYLLPWHPSAPLILGKQAIRVCGGGSRLRLKIAAASARHAMPVPFLLASVSGRAKGLLPIFPPGRAGQDA
jgi:hypothetical protein